jgi:signal peptidase I
VAENLLKKGKISNKLIKALAIFWASCVIVVLGIIFYVTQIRKETFDKAPDIFGFFLFAFIFLGSLVFIFECIIIIVKVLKNKFLQKQNYLILFLRLLFVFAFLPIYALNYVLKPIDLIKQIKSRNLEKINLKILMGKIGTTIGILSVLFPIWIGGIGLAVYFTVLFLGLKPLDIPLRGNSMLPTFSDGEIIKAYHFNKFLSFFKKPKKGDVIVFQSGKTFKEGELVSYIKRIIAVPGDEILIKDGFVYLNGEILEEPYTFKPRSTFGGIFIEECKPLKIPNDYFFVLGDNRKRSEDSRNLGLVSLNEIKYILPFEKQKEYKNKWRNASKDKDFAGLPSFNISFYYEKINEIRKKNNLKILKINKKLEEAAIKRAGAIINFNELKVDPKESKYPLEQALKDVKYSNILTGEISTVGYFDEEELVNYWLEFETKEYILNKDYQETGIVALIGKVNNCETQIIVQIFGGYIPPNYSKEVIDSWRNILARLKEIQPGWAKLKEYKEFYEKNKQDIDRINEIISIRISNISAIISRMETNQWLTGAEQKMIDQDSALYNEQETIASRLNRQ